ncbi:methyltransferase domain-containing protein [Actinomadura xylanilytica]|uniref:methyltransferase domain-containing protein n=1 Tax=Actinomadura xylanilytica TaxID=887459 RepID=UPI00255AE1BA|nr:methyltransferase domain-containing protein [Actinomadura xylanilytica]MDL4771457.1 protein-L-isoaspartate(D-aspartate) O-methyltransferase [Actinomadura xylanilytica]
MTTEAPGDLRDRVDRLADALARAGRLTDERWRAALHAVPRHLFAPPSALVVPDRPRYESFAIDRDADPDAWWDAVYSDAAIAAQVDDGAADGAGTWTSSCSSPSVVVIFLHALRPLDHHRVLEIGTGTGWTAGLLAWRLGAPNVTSVEIDGALSARAAANLEAAGLSPRLLAGDGADGAPDGAPYDRVHVTCGVERVPDAWAGQSRPGGVLVFPWSPGWGMGHVARLTVTGDATATGRLTGAAGFMMLRSQRRPSGVPGPSADADASTTRLDPRATLSDSAGAEVAIAAQVPGVRSQIATAPDGSCRIWAIENQGADPAWAAADFVPGDGDHTVLQYGARRLWDEVEAAYFAWVSWGRPCRERFGLTAGPAGQAVWLDRPAQIVRPP